MLNKMLSITAFSSVIATALAGAAFANSDFCGDATTCQDITINNRSAALVTSVKVTQEKTDGACALDDRNFSKNLNGMGGENVDGDYFSLSVNTSCQYKIKYKTTDGCTGDKTTHLTPDNFKKGKTYTELRGACGSLKTQKG